MAAYVQMKLMELIEILYRNGLCELPVYFTRANGAYLGNLIYEKNNLVLKDRGYLPESTLELNDVNLDDRILGMVCNRQSFKWESLTFFGLAYCNTSVEQDPELYKTLCQSKDKDNNRLYDFVGSIYRAYQALTKNDFLPVILLQRMSNLDGCEGLAVVDLKAAILTSDEYMNISQKLKNAVEYTLSIQLENIPCTKETPDFLSTTINRMHTSGLS